MAAHEETSLDMTKRFANHREAYEWYTNAERNLLVSYVGVNAAPLQQILDVIRESHKEFWFHELHDASHRERVRTSELDAPDEKQKRVREQEDFFMPTERHEPEKVNAQFVKITKIGQSIAGTITRFGENDNGQFMVLGGEPGKFAYAREQVGGEWMKFDSFAVGLSAGLVRKINADRDKGINVLAHYRDNEQMEKGGTKKVFKVMQLDAGELAEIDAKATDNREARAKQEVASGKPLPIFAESARAATGDDDNLI